MENNNNKSSRRSLETVMTYFTDDLWSEIFLRLPFKSLLQFKSVSKSWYSIISSQRFAKSHLDRAIANGEEEEDHKTLIVHHHLAFFDDDVDLCEQEDFPYSLINLTSGNILQNLAFPYSRTEYPFQPVQSRIVGTNCGIVCLSVDLSIWPASNRNYDIYLWNPATKLSKLILQPQPLEPSRFTSSALGFGFDHIDFDFKVVKIVTFSAEVYSSNKDAWRKIEPKLADVPFNHNNFHVCLHGYLLASGYKGMMAFDLNKEVFICDIKLPVSDCFVLITDFNDSIAVCYCERSENTLINLWTLDDEACLTGGTGVQVSWTKMLSIQADLSISHVGALFNSVEFLLVDEESNWFLYNPNTEESSDNLIYSEVLKYTKSLFSFVGSKPITWTASSPVLQEYYSDSEMEMDEESISDIDDD